MNPAREFFPLAGRRARGMAAKFVSRWSGRDRERFLRLGEKLYFMTMDEVVELKEEDILLGKGGWDRSPAAAK